MIWDVAVVVGALSSGTAVLLSLLIDESIQLHLVSALVFAAVPAAAALVLGAMLVCLLRLLGIVYDLLRTPLLPALVFCVCSGTAVLMWIKRGARRVVDVTPFVAGWPIRSSARLILRLIENRDATRSTA